MGSTKKSLNGLILIFLFLQATVCQGRPTLNVTPDVAGFISQNNSNNILIDIDRRNADLSPPKKRSRSGSRSSSENPKKKKNPKIKKKEVGNKEDDIGVSAEYRFSDDASPPTGIGSVEDIYEAPPLRNPSYTRIEERLYPVSPLLPYSNF